MDHNPEIQENEVMELNACHMLGVDFPSRKGKQTERDLKEKLRVNIQQKDQLCCVSSWPSVGLAVLFSCKMKRNVKDRKTQIPGKEKGQRGVTARDTGKIKRIIGVRPVRSYSGSHCVYVSLPALAHIFFHIRSARQNQGELPLSL